MSDQRGTLSALAESGAGEWIAILSLVFGGCCSNVWALEAVLKSYPSSGTFLTFAQFLYVAIQTFSTQLYYPPGAWLPRWRANKVPMARWAVQVILFFGVNIMNNYAFGLKIPITVHIIFRSGGLCVSMLTGYFIGGKRYSAGQIVAGVIITAGIVMSTIAAPRPPKAKTTGAAPPPDGALSWLPENAQYAAGIALLSLALFLSAWLGLWQEETYRKYGKQWREALFYCHTLSLPLFIPMAGSLSRTLTAYLASPPMTLFALPAPDFDAFTAAAVGTAVKPLFRWHELAVPRAFLALALNVITQGVCIRGVNRLTTRVSSTTVNLILTLRKAASLSISVWYYGSGVTPGLVVGGALVLGGTMVYSFAPPPVDPRAKKHEEEVKAGNGAETDGVEKNTATASASAVKANDRLRHRHT